MGLNLDKKAVTKFSIIKLTEYSFLLPAIGVLTMGLYHTYGKPIVADTARQQAIIVADSVINEKKIYFENQTKQIKIIQNYMRLQNEELYNKAKSLEED